MSIHSLASSAIRPFRQLPLLLAAGTLLAPSAVLAQQTTTQWYDAFRQPLGEWNVIVGGGVSVAPAYEGSNEFDISPVPYVSAQFGRLTIDTRGATVDVYEWDRLRFDFTVGYDSG
ncbi:MipA/OmpV family protein, partial [Geminicoccus flavidas]|uniref:MipA/OmpV family protein n=1 Tax=Geminicoccus flavidas TaxID=2506407 RepID=UPI00190F44E1